MRKRLAFVGHSEEGLSLIPLLEANPDVEICAILTRDAEAARQVLQRVEPNLGERFGSLLTADAGPLLRTPGLAALIDADAPTALREVLNEALERGVQVTTPLIAKLLYAFGPIDASRKPDLLQTLSEILESYNLTVDRRGLLNRILQMAMGATGADRGSLMLYDEEDGRLKVEVAIGIEKELLPKIRLRPGEGIAGRAFQDRRPLLLTGKADHSTYLITREREDVGSAISAPLIHENHVLGVLNLSHGRRHGTFDDDDLHFVEQLARLDAKIILRAEEYHRLLRESVHLRTQAEVRRRLAMTEPLVSRLNGICQYLTTDFEGGVCQIYLRDPELDVLTLQASSTWRDPLGTPTRLRRGEGIVGWVARGHEPVLLSRRVDGVQVCFAALPLAANDEMIGVLAFEGASEGPIPELIDERLTAAAEAVARELADLLRELRMEREATKMSAITETAARMSMCEDSAELYRTITTSAAIILEAEHALLRLQDEASGRFSIRSYFGSADTDAQAALFALEKELAIAAIKERGPLRIPDLGARPELAAHRVTVSSALVYPLRRDARIVGTLSVLGKATHALLCAEAFTGEDQTVMMRFVEHAQRSLAHVQEREQARHRQRFDDLTGLPNAAQLRERLEQEIARSSGRGRTLALVRARITGLAELLAEQEEAEGDHLVLSIAQELRAALRDFDVVARTSPDTFEILIPEPDADVQSVLGPLARRAGEAIRRDADEAIRDRLKLEFGYALYPEEAQTPKALQERSREARIRSV